MPLSVTVVVPASRPAALGRLLQSLIRARRPADFECLVVLNGSARECERAAAAAAGALPGLRTLPGPRPPSLGGARNAALPQARGEWLCFLDDDVRVPEDYFETLAAAVAAHPDAAAVGGPNLTPVASGALERWCGRLLASRFCAGPMSRRYRADGASATWVDDSALILCNLALDARALEESGLRFDEELVRNEENLLLDQLRGRGRRLLYVPALAVEHERRPSAAAFARQCFLSGRGRAEMTLKRPSSLRAHHLAPAALLAAGAALPLSPRALGPLLAAYAAASVANAAWLAARHREGPLAAACMALLGPLGQLSYGVGLVAGGARAALAPGRALRPQGQEGEAPSQRQAISRGTDSGT